MTECRHATYNRITNTCSSCGASYIPSNANPYPNVKRVITWELYQNALHDHNQPEQWRRQVIKDYETETRAICTFIQGKQTLKDIVDDLVFNQGCTNWVRRGGWLYESTADSPTRYMLRADYGPYLLIAVRSLDPFRKDI